MSSSGPASSGIRTSASGQSYIPSSRRADGSTRKEIKVRPGYKPPEDVQKYKSRTTEAQRLTGPPGVTSVALSQESEAKSKNARRREAARRRKEEEPGGQDILEQAQSHLHDLSVEDQLATLQVQDPRPVGSLQLENAVEDAEAERQKKVRNALKKLRAVRDLKDKKSAGEKLSADQLIKLAKEPEILRDLAKLQYDGPEIAATS